jgi:hypothetical protein
VHISVSIRGRRRSVHVVFSVPEFEALAIGQTLAGDGGVLIVSQLERPDIKVPYLLIEKDGSATVLLPADQVDQLRKKGRCKIEAMDWPPEDLCPRCHRPVEANHAFCPGCATPFDPVRAETPLSFGDTIRYIAEDWEDRFGGAPKVEEAPDEAEATEGATTP